MSAPHATPSPPAAAGGLSPFRVIHAAVFLGLLAYWTYLLLKPSPVPESFLAGFSWFDKELAYFLLAKALHLGCYAFMALLGGSLFPAGRRRTLVFALLVLHGSATEVGQWVGNRYYGTNRFGSPRDVLIDAAGVAAGAFVLRRAGRLSSRSR